MYSMTFISYNIDVLYYLVYVFRDTRSTFTGYNIDVLYFLVDLSHGIFQELESQRQQEETAEKRRKAQEDMIERRKS